MRRLPIDTLLAKGKHVYSRARSRNPRLPPSSGGEHWVSVSGRPYIALPLAAGKRVLLPVTFATPNRRGLEMRLQGGLVMPRIAAD